MLKRTESLAWLVLLTSFLACVVLALGVPLSLRWYALNGMRPLRIVLQARDGDVKYQAPGSSDTVLVEIAGGIEIKPRSQIQLEENGDALLLFYHPDEPETPVVTIQLYNATTLNVGSARTPRFAFSPLSHEITLDVSQALRMLVAVEGNGRDANVHVDTPQGPIDMSEGYFALEVHDAVTDVSVKTGRAQVFDPQTGERPLVVALQRTQMTASGLGEIYVGERDILRNRNGNLDEPLEDSWVVYTDKAYDDEPEGSVRWTQVGDGNHIVLFARPHPEQGDQVHWAEVGIRQEINQDIRGISSLRVGARVRIDFQTLSVCGSRGTECPLMLRIYYLDGATGARREWIQGFYAVAGDNDDFCHTCDWKAEHIQVAGQTVWYNYESPDLLPLLREQGTDPASLLEVQVYASGHVYGSALDNVAILVGE